MFIDADMLMDFCMHTIRREIDCNDIARFPVTDAVPVVRCRDCRFFETDVVRKVDGIPLIVGHDYIKGKSDYGYPDTISIFDIWQNPHAISPGKAAPDDAEP